MDQGIMFTSEPILLRDADDQALASDGYVIFPFLTGSAIQKLSDYYVGFQKEEPAHFYSSTHSSNTAFRKQSSDLIREVIAPFMDTHFKNYRLLGGAFVVKPAKGKGILPPHQDWNLVDETKARSYNIWIPLTDVTFENGAVCVLPGSHAKMPTYRGPGIPSLFKEVEALVWKHLDVLPMKAGEALFYDHALLHASPVNATDKIRLGIVCGMTSLQSEMQLYFNHHDKIEAYRIAEDFFMEKDPMKGPEGLTHLETAEHQTALSAEKFQEVFLSSKEKRSWLKKLFRMS